MRFDASGRTHRRTGYSTARPRTAREAARRGAPGSPARRSWAGSSGSATRRAAATRPQPAAMGVFKHEAAAVDPHGRRIYMTEDLIDGGLYRFTPTRWHDLSDGLLEIATVGRGGSVTWSEVPEPGARRVDTRSRYAAARASSAPRESGTTTASCTCRPRRHRVYAYDIERGAHRGHSTTASRRGASAAAARRPADRQPRPARSFVYEDIATNGIASA